MCSDPSMQRHLRMHMLANPVLCMVGREYTQRRLH